MEDNKLERIFKDKVDSILFTDIDGDKNSCDFCDKNYKIVIEDTGMYEDHFSEFVRIAQRKVGEL